jgi:hypothetical protein
MNRSRSGSLSGVARWAGVPARATSSANPAGELMRIAWMSSVPPWTMWGTCSGVAEPAGNMLSMGSWWPSVSSAVAGW